MKATYTSLSVKASISEEGKTNFCTLSRQGQNDAPADSTGASRDNRDFSVQ